MLFFCLCFISGNKIRVSVTVTDTQNLGQIHFKISTTKNFLNAQNGFLGPSAPPHIALSIAHVPSNCLAFGAVADDFGP